jgi:hypothetical protein
MSPPMPPLLLIGNPSSTHRARIDRCMAEHRPVSFDSEVIGDWVVGNRHRLIIGRCSTKHWPIVDRCSPVYERCNIQRTCIVGLAVDLRLSIKVFGTDGSVCPKNFYWELQVCSYCWIWSVKTVRCPAGNRCHIGLKMYSYGVTFRTGMYGLRTMPVAVTEDYLADDDRCWGIAHTTDLRPPAGKCDWGLRSCKAMSPPMSHVAPHRQPIINASFKDGPIYGQASSSVCWIWGHLGVSGWARDIGWSLVDVRPNIGP